MLSKSKKIAVASAAALLLVGAFLLIPRLQESRQGTECRKLGANMSPAQLRERVIKNYLHSLLRSNRQHRESGSLYSLALLPRHMAAEDIVQALREASLLKQLTMQPKLLTQHAEIEQLDGKLLQQDLMVANYSLQQRELDLMPTQSLQLASSEDIANVLRTQSMQGRRSFAISERERTRGFGEHFFFVRHYTGISLACCDGLGKKQGLSADWFVRNSVKNIQSSPLRFFVASKCGDILERKIDDYLVNMF